MSSKSRNIVITFFLLLVILYSNIMHGWIWLVALVIFLIILVFFLQILSGQFSGSTTVGSEKEPYTLPMTSGGAFLIAIIGGMILFLFSILIWPQLIGNIKSILLQYRSTISMVGISTPMIYVFFRYDLYKVPPVVLNTLEFNLPLYANIMTMLFSIANQFNLLSSGIAQIDMPFILPRTVAGIMLSIVATYLHKLIKVRERQMNEKPNITLVRTTSTVVYTQKPSLLSSGSLIAYGLAGFIVLWTLADMLLYSVTL